MSPDDLVWRGQRLGLRAVEPYDVPRLVALHRSLVQERPAEDSPDAWFRVGGPWMHDYYCERHVRVYRELGWDAWVIVGEGDEILGNAELLYVDEPEPFGRYGHLELLELSADLRSDEVESWVLKRCEERTVERGRRRFSCRPNGSGGSRHVLIRQGYEEFWRSGHLRLRNLERFALPAHRATRLRGDYAAEASRLLALNHREAAEYRWRYLWRPVLDPAASDYPTDVSLWGAHLELDAGTQGVCLVNVWHWLDRQVAHADLWVPPDALGDHERIMGLVAVAAERALRMGSEALDVYLPEPLANEFAGGDNERLPLEMGDPWFRRLLDE